MIPTHDHQIFEPISLDTIILYWFYIHLLDELIDPHRFLILTASHRWLHHGFCCWPTSNKFHWTGGPAPLAGRATKALVKHFQEQIEVGSCWNYRYTKHGVSNHEWLQFKDGYDLPKGRSRIQLIIVSLSFRICIFTALSACLLR